MAARQRYFVKGVSCRIGEEALLVVNLSRGGFFATTSRLPQPGQSLELELLIEPTTVLRAVGTVRWTNEQVGVPEEGRPRGFGVALTGIEPEARAAIVEVLKRSDPTQGPSASW